MSIREPVAHSPARATTPAAGVVVPAPAARTGTAGPAPAGRGLVAALVFCSLCASVSGSLGVLLIPTLSREFDVSRGAAQWVLTAALLVGAVATPLLGALSDRPYRRTALLCALGLVLLGTLLSATATSFPQLVAGRAFMGITYGIIPMATAIARVNLPPRRARSAIAALSVTTVTGAGLSFPLTGFIVHFSTFRMAFAFAAVFTILALIAIAAATPRQDPAEPPPAGRLDVLGAASLAGALASLLLAISEGGTWGWTSPAVLGLFAASAVLFPLWVRHELGTRHPLVRLRSLRRSPVALASTVALVQGAMLFAGSSAVTQLVQTPVAAGYGFGLSLAFAGLMMLPNTVGSQVSHRIVRVLLRRVPASRLLAFGPALVGLDFAFLAFFHDQLWQVVVGISLQGLGIGVSFVVMPLMILSVVPAEETGSAVAFNAVLRTVGGSIGSAITGAVLAWSTLTGSTLPDEHGYTVIFAMSAVGCAVLVTALLVVPVLLRRPRERRAG